MMELRAEIKKTRMWANAQRDGRPAEYRWCPLLNAAKFADTHYLSAVVYPTFGRFSRTPTCDRETDRHMITAHTALSWRCAAKLGQNLAKLERKL